MSLQPTDPEYARPLELDFDRDPEGTPARMHRAIDYIMARIRAVEAVKPEFLSLIDLLRGVGLQRIQDGIVPVMELAMQVRDSLQEIRDRWEGDLLPAEVVAQAIAGVLGTVFTRAEVTALVGGYTPTDTAYTKAELNALIAPFAIAADVWTKAQSDARYLGVGQAPRLMPVGSVVDSVLKWVGPGQYDYAPGGLAGFSWGAVATVAASGQAVVTFAALPQTYSDLLIEMNGISLTTGSEVTVSVYDGAAWSAAGVLAYLGQTSDIVTGACLVTRYRGDSGLFLCGHGPSGAPAGPWVGTANNLAQPIGWHCAGGIRGIRLASAGTFDAGGFALFAR
ncbi:MAG: hypothetical protein V4537_15960 [Pseudomonadota bacterium]